MWLNVHKNLLWSVHLYQCTTPKPIFKIFILTPSILFQMNILYTAETGFTLHSANCLSLFSPSLFPTSVVVKLVYVFNNISFLLFNLSQFILFTINIFIKYCLFASFKLYFYCKFLDIINLFLLLSNPSLKFYQLFLHTTHTHTHTHTHTEDI